MNPELLRLASECQLAEQHNEPVRLAFALACVRRVRHLLEDPQAIRCLAVLEAYVAGNANADALAAAASEAAAIAGSHQGSNSIDGSAHAAVSGTYAMANALAGRALEAASYAAYAVVYSYGAYAVGDPAAFAAEFAWQVRALQELCGVATAGVAAQAAQATASARTA